MTLTLDNNGGDFYLRSLRTPHISGSIVVKEDRPEKDILNTQTIADLLLEKYTGEIFEILLE